MKRLALIYMLLTILNGCTTERSVEPADAERAADLNAQLGLGYMQQGRYDVAMQKLDKALKFNPKNSQAHLIKAELHRRVKEFSKAKDHYEIALDLSPNDAAVHNNYGVFLCDIKDYDGAQTQFDIAINDPLYSAKDQVYENIGLCDLSRGILRKGEEALRTALQLNPKLPKSLLNLAQLSFDKNETQVAHGYFGRFLAVSQHTAASLWLGYLLEKERGNTESATSYAMSLKGKFPDSKEAELLRKLDAKKGK
jgi:type IV pilus assembly protein PilF